MLSPQLQSRPLPQKDGTVSASKAIIRDRSLTGSSAQAAFRAPRGILATHSVSCSLDRLVVVGFGDTATPPRLLGGGVRLMAHMVQGSWRLPPSTGARCSTLRRLVRSEAQACPKAVLRVAFVAVGLLPVSRRAAQPMLGTFRRGLHRWRLRCHL